MGETQVHPPQLAAIAEGRMLLDPHSSPFEPPQALPLAPPPQAAQAAAAALGLPPLPRQVLHGLSQASTVPLKERKVRLCLGAVLSDTLEPFIRDRMGAKTGHGAHAPKQAGAPCVRQAPPPLSPATPPSRMRQQRSSAWQTEAAGASELRSLFGGAEAAPGHTGSPVLQPMDSLRVGARFEGSSARGVMLTGGSLSASGELEGTERGLGSWAGHPGAPPTDAAAAALEVRTS